MTKQDIFTLLSNVLGIETESIQPESDLYEDLNAESTDMIELKLQLEDQFKTKLDEDQFEQLETVEDLMALIEDVTGEIIS